MITINVDPRGEVTISSETIEERAAMSKVYGAKEDFNHDEERAKFFSEGWGAAVRESQLRFVNGQLLDFYNEQGTGAMHPNDLLNAAQLHESLYGSQEPHNAEPEGTGEASEEDWPSDDYEGFDYDVAQAVEEELPVDAHAIKPVVDSGEPELESQEYDRGNNQTFDPLNTGTWTMSNDELQSRLDAAYQRGFDQKKATTERYLQIAIREINSNLFPEGYGQSTKEEVLVAVAIELAKRLGFEVSA